MNVGMPSPRQALWKGKSPTLAELGTLLEFVSDAAVLLDRSRGTILFANLALVNLSAFPAVELTGKTLQELLQGSLAALPSAGETTTARLARKNRALLDVQVNAFQIDGSNTWTLVKFLPIQSLEDQKCNEGYLRGILEFSRLMEKRDLQNGLEQAVQILHNVLGFEIAGVYQAESDQPRLRLAAAFDRNLVLPDTLPSTDLIRLPTTTIWHPGKRVITDLHRSGRLKEVKYLASVPLGEPGARSGLLVVGESQTQPDADLTQLLEILGTMLGSALDQGILIANQKQMIEHQDQALAMRGVLSENVREGILVLGTDLQIREINPVAEVMLGYSEDEVKNQPVENILIGSDLLMPALTAAQEGLPTHNLGNTTLHHRDGQAIPVMLQTVPVEHGGLVKSILVVITDVSAEEQIRLRTLQLEQRAIIGEVTQVFAHEIRNPINNISLALEEMSVVLDEQDPNQELVNRMQGDCQRLSHIMDDILAFSRANDARFERIDLQQLMRRILERWRPRLHKVNVNPLFQIEPNIPNVRGDSRALDRVFTNLISNAMDAMAPLGGGTLVIKISPLSQIPNIPQVEISVTDNGPGIPEDILEHIFEPFVTNKPRGTGLGLAITKQIVTGHRGTIRADSFPGGTVFRVILPAHTSGE